MRPSTNGIGVVISILHLWLMIAMPFTAVAHSASTGEAMDGAALRAFWSTLDDAWNRRDAVAFSQLYADDVSFAYVDRGEWLSGRDAVLERFSAQFPGMAADLRHRTHIEKYRSIAPDVVGVDGTVEILRETPDASAAPTIIRRFSIFSVMVQGSDGWTIRELQIYQLPSDTEEVAELKQTEE